MNFTEIQAEVLRLTGRPDKVPDTNSSINRVVSLLTLQGNFPQDKLVATLAINASLYGDTISLSALTRFRRFTYVKPTGQRLYLSPLSADKIFTPKDSMQRNKYFLSGATLTYTLQTLSTGLEVEYLTYPPILSPVAPNDTHWMFTHMPHAIIDLAASRIFKLIGDDTAAKQYEISGMEVYLAARRDISQGE